jgi:hypothetical protein
MEKILVYSAAGSVVTIALGTLIINLSLNEYSLTDYNLLQPHAITVGLAFLFWIALHVFSFFMLVDLENFKSNSRTKLIQGAIIKFFLLLSILFEFMGGLEYRSNSNWTLRVCDWQLNLGRMSFGIPFFSIVFLCFFYFDWLINKKNLVNRLMYFLFKISVVAAIFNFMIYYDTPLYSDLLGFECCFFLAFSINSVILLEIRNSDQFSNSNNWFSPNSQPKKSKLFYVVFGIFIFCLGLIFLIRNYTRNIYPHIPQTFGGGKFEDVHYRTANKLFIGRRIYETDKNIYLLVGDSLLKLDWADVEVIVPHPTQFNAD